MIVIFSSKDKVAKIVIIEPGSIGLSVMERLVSLRKYSPCKQIELHIFEPNTLGTGIHYQDQPDHFRLNTIVGKLSI